MTIQIRNGVFTPWAAILCNACDKRTLEEDPSRSHYARRLEQLRKIDVEAMVDQPSGELVAMCDECHRPCWVRDDVAICQRISYAVGELDRGNLLSECSVAQTGGMCCALVAVTKDGRNLVATAMDGPISLGEYPNDEWNDPLRDDCLGENDGGDWTDPEKLNEAVQQAAARLIEWAASQPPSGE